MKKAVLLMFAAVAALSASSSCTKENENLNPVSSTYVLVHGAWQAPYVWNEVRSNLASKGNKVIVVELPGHGNDQTAPHIISLDLYRDKVIEAISKTDGRIILVGHSMAGMVISHVAEKIPSRISRLVYIGAFLPSTGQSLTDLANTDPDAKLGPSLVPSADQLTVDIKRENLADLFIRDGSPAAMNKVLMNYRAEPAIPLINKVVLTSENFGSVEKVYIKTMQDIVISPGLQDRMINDAGIKRVYEVNTSHSPFLSQPKTISEMLISIGQ